MEKLLFERSKIPSDRRSLVVRISNHAYKQVQEISIAAGLTVTEVATRMINFAAQHTEVK